MGHLKLPSCLLQVGHSGRSKQGGVFGFTSGKWADTDADMQQADEELMLQLAPGQDRCLSVPSEAKALLRVTIRLKRRAALQHHDRVLLEAVFCGRCLPARLLMAGREVAASSSSGEAMALDLGSLAKEEEGMLAVVEADVSAGVDVRLPAAGTLRLNLWSAEEEAGSAGASRLLASERILLLPEDCALAAQEVSSCCNDDLLADLTIVVESAFVGSYKQLASPPFTDCRVLQSTAEDLLDWAVAGNCTATALLLRQCASRNAEQCQGAGSTADQQQHMSQNYDKVGPCRQAASQPSLEGQKAAAVPQQPEMMRQAQRSAVRLQAVVQRSFELPIPAAWAALIVLHPLLSVTYNSIRFGYSECGWPLAVIHQCPAELPAYFLCLKCCTLLPLSSLSFDNPSSICLQNSPSLSISPSIPPPTLRSCFCTPQRLPASLIQPHAGGSAHPSAGPLPCGCGVRAAGSSSATSAWCSTCSAWH